MKTQVSKQANTVAIESNLHHRTPSRCFLLFVVLFLGVWTARAGTLHPFSPYQWRSATCAGNTCTWTARGPFPTFTATSTNGWRPGGGPYPTHFTPPLQNEFSVGGDGDTVVITLPSGLTWGSNGGELILGNIHNYFEYNLSATDGTNPIDVNAWKFLGEDITSTSSTSSCVGGTAVNVLPNGTCWGKPTSKGFYVYDPNAPASSGQGGVVALGNLPSNVRTITLTLVSNNLGNMLPNGAGSDYVLFNVGQATVTLTGGTWKPLTNQPRFHTGAALLLTDGTVLAHEESDRPSDNANYGNWYRLTPDVYGSYINGTWSTVPSTLPSPYGPLFFASAVLPDGRAIVEGGEYNIPNGTSDTALGALFENNPKSSNFNKWTPVTPPGNWVTIGDAQSAVLPDGTFMLANCCNTDEAETTSDGSSWVATGIHKHDINDEEGWTLLPGPPDAEVLLTVDTSVLSDSTCGLTGSEMYINGLWFCIANTPMQLWDNSSHEMGPAVLRPDGTVFQAGGTNQSGTGQSALFDTSTFTWSAGPNFPPNLDVADGPAALLPNGNVLVMASPGLFSPPSSFYEFQYGTDALVSEGSNLPPNASNDSSEEGHMLVLPTGQIYFADFSKDVEIYTPTSQVNENSWYPVVKDINNYAVANCFGSVYRPPLPPPCLTISQGNTNTLDGFQLNGLSQGAAFGDDYQSATNYPLVRIEEELIPFCIAGTSCPVPRVYYCRTHDHTSMGVATGSLLVSTKFDCPNVPVGFKGYLEVVANGISTEAAPVVVGP